MTLAPQVPPTVCCDPGPTTFFVITTVIYELPLHVDLNLQWRAVRYTVRRSMLGPRWVAVGNPGVFGVLSFKLQLRPLRVVSDGAVLR
jgi:hypothetical protein